MLGKDSKPQLEPIDPSKVRSMRQSSLRASHKQDSASHKGGFNATPSIQSSDKKSQLDNFSSLGGTPGKRASSRKIDIKTGKAAGSKAGFGVSSTRSGFGATVSMKSGSVRDKQEDDFDLEDF